MSPRFRRRGVLGRHDVRDERLAQDQVGVRQVHVPERAVLPHQRLLAGDAVHQHVQPALLLLDAGDQRGDLGLVGVIDADRNGLSARRRDEGRRLVDRLGSLVGRGMAGNASPGAVDRCTGFRQGARDSAPGAAGRARDEGNLFVQSRSRSRGCGKRQGHLS